MRRSACFITLFSVCSLQRVKSLIIYPDIPLDYKVATQPEYQQVDAATWTQHFKEHLAVSIAKIVFAREAAQVPK